MQNQIILISNRGVRPSRTNVTLFKNALTKASHRLRCAEVKDIQNRKGFKLTLVDQGNEQKFITEAVQNGNNNPWVFFVHGNNQTLAKNLKKCFRLEEIHNVNIIAFSWPSVHYGKVRAILSLIPNHANAWSFVTNFGTRKIKQYSKARKNAVLSAKDLGNALEMASSAFATVDNRTVFVSHSLGNYVLENLKDHRPLNESLAGFEKVLLHQADVENENHRNWVDTIGKGDSVIVTTNEYDEVLYMSNLYNHRLRVNSRLGNVPKPSEPGPTLYKDFTGQTGIGFSGHTIFLTRANKNVEAYNFFKDIFNPNGN